MTKTQGSNLRKIFQKFLKDRHYKQTGERYTILDAIENMDSHFEADELVMQLRREGKRISRATVYRTLHLLEECGIVRRVRFGESHNHFELSLDKANHAHLICTVCGKVIEFDDSRLEEVQEQICKTYGFSPVQRMVEIYGVCPECQKEPTRGFKR